MTLFYFFLWKTQIKLLILGLSLLKFDGRIDNMGFITKTEKLQDNFQKSYTKDYSYLVQKL